MKKLLLFILIFTLILSIVSCGKKSDTDSTDKDETTTMSDTSDSTIESKDTSSHETTVTNETSASEGTPTSENTTETDSKATETSDSTETTEDAPPKTLSLIVDEQRSLDSFNIEQKICFVSKFTFDSSPEVIFLYDSVTWKFEIEGVTYEIDPSKIYYESLENAYLMKWDLESAGFMPDFGKNYNLKIFAFLPKKTTPTYEGETSFTANLGKKQNGDIVKDAPNIPFDINDGNRPFGYIKVGNKNNVVLTLLFKRQVYELLKDLNASNLVWNIKIGDTMFTFENIALNKSVDTITVNFDVESKGFIPYKSMVYVVGGSISDKSGNVLFNLSNKAVVANIVAGMIPDLNRVGTIYDHSNMTPISGSMFLPNENYTKLFDGDIETKMYEPENMREPVIFKTAEAIKIKSYSLVTANDNSAYGRVPTGWTLYGSTTGNENDWHIIDTRENDPINEINDFREYNFSVENDISYTYYKFVFEGGAIQFSEIKLCI